MEWNEDIERLLLAMNAGDQAAFDAVFTQIHQQLRRIAADRYRGGTATNSPTAIVDEAWQRMREHSMRFNNLSHFEAICVVQMQRVFADYWRRRKSQRRGGDAVRVALDEFDVPGKSTATMYDLAEIGRAIDELGQLDREAADVAMLRIHAGMTLDQITTSLRNVDARDETGREHPAKLEIRRAWKRALVFIRSGRHGD